MMAAMLYPERRVMAVCGDGGFMMNSQELETAVRLKLNLVVLIVEDNAYGMIRWKQAVEKFPDWGLTFNNPDFVKYAEAYGATGARVEATDDLIPAIEAAFKAGGVHLVTVPIDYSENVRVLVDELKSRQLAPSNDPVRGAREVRGLALRRFAGWLGRALRCDGIDREPSRQPLFATSRTRETNRARP